MIIETDGYRIDFTDAINAFKFDETDKTKLTYHGATVLKAVDIIAELPEAYLFIEIKEYDKPEDFHDDFKADKAKYDNFKWLKRYLKYKYRDSYLYRYSEDKVDKPVHYICLLNFDNALNYSMRENLHRELPVGQVSPRWVRPFAQSCQVLNLAAWNRNFTKWPAQKVTTA